MYCGYYLGAVEYQEQHLFSHHVCKSTLMNLVKIIYLPLSVKHNAAKCVIRKFWVEKMYNIRHYCVAVASNEHILGVENKKSLIPFGLWSLVQRKIKFQRQPLWDCLLCNHFQLQNNCVSCLQFVWQKKKNKIKIIY